MSESAATPGIGARVFHMLVFAVAFWILCWVLAATAIVQLLLRLTTGAPAADLQRFGAALGRYAAQVVAFLTFASEQLPFPFGSWPERDAAAVRDDPSTP